jgi:hypothetical protein
VLARPDGYTVLHAAMTIGEPGVRPDAGPAPAVRRLRPRIVSLRRPPAGRNAADRAASAS